MGYETQLVLRVGRYLITVGRRTTPIASYLEIDDSVLLACVRSRRRL